jgi:carbon monoxide dehydrogenase subunit G
MDIEGTYTLHGPPEEIWGYLKDQQVLQRTIPGIERIEALNEERYAVAIHVGPTPLTGSYQGQITVTERHHPYYYRIAIEGEGQQSSINGVGDIHLSSQGENTIVSYKGKLNLGKIDATLPTPVVRGAAKLLIQQFFSALADHLRTANPTPAVAIGEHVRGITTLEQPGGKIVILPASPRSTFLETIVRRLGLGAGDPAAEALWVNRLRRTGVLLGLLLLVWIGTRIPRK